MTYADDLLDVLRHAHARLNMQGAPKAEPHTPWEQAYRSHQSHRKLTDRDEATIRTLRAEGTNRAALAARFRVSPSTIDRIIRRTEAA